MPHYEGIRASKTILLWPLGLKSLIIWYLDPLGSIYSRTAVVSKEFGLKDSSHSGFCGLTQAGSSGVFMVAASRT